MLKKILSLILAILFVTGCASYKYELASDPYKGYVVKRNDYLVPEYTADTKNTAPQDLNVAKARFKRRHRIVDHYYKKMDKIENQFSALVLGYPLFLASLVSAVFRLPFIIVSDYRYDHDPKYRQRIDDRDDARDKREEERIKNLQSDLNKFIEEDMNKEAKSSQPL